MANMEGKASGSYKPKPDERTRLQRVFEALRPVLNERMRRLVAAAEAQALGHGGVSLVSAISGLSRRSITNGIRELADPQQINGCRRPPSLEAAAAATEAPPVCRPHLGRRRIEEKHPEIESVLEEILADEVAGDPMKRQKWVRRSLRQLSQDLREQGYGASPPVVARLLKKMGYSLKVSIKRKKGFRGDPSKRDEQFRYIASQRREFADNSLPAISVDTKKKELIGDFRQSGKTWCRGAEEVNQYDFRSLAICKAVPYGIYDVNRNQGWVYVGTSADTPEFAVDAIARWWKEEGRLLYSGVSSLLILADGGGCNGWRSRAWKIQLQRELSDAQGLTITVCHYPTRCSEWNPVERRLFSQISTNWAGKPLRTLETMLGYIRDTSTTTGLRVSAFLQDGSYERGRTVSKQEMDQLNLRAHEVCPDWNYTIRPRESESLDS